MYPLGWGRTIALAVTALQLGPACAESPLSAAPRRLSAFGLFVGDLALQQPAPGVVPYEINTPLFSDYAEKLRFARIPAGGSAAYRLEGAFDFPVGTVLVKTFFYPEGPGASSPPRRLVETRLLIHEDEGWVGLPYVWNEAQTEAELRAVGARIPLDWTDGQGRRRRIEYRVPGVAECGLCHRADGRSMSPLATKAAQLNRPVSNGEPSNQLRAWEERGLLTGLPPLERVPRYPVWNDDTSGSLEDRARAYLDANCAHCHNPVGPASGAGLDLRYEQRKPFRFGVFKRPVAAGRGAGDHLYDIWPGRPDASILTYRLESLEAGVMMPELGRTLVDREGTDLVRAWIAALEETDLPDR